MQGFLLAVGRKRRNAYTKLYYRSKIKDIKYMEQTKSKINETVVTRREFRKLVDPIVKSWPRISGWVKTIDTSQEESTQITSKIVKGRTFQNSNYKGRIIEFREPNKPFHKGVIISEDN